MQVWFTEPVDYSSGIQEDGSYMLFCLSWFEFSPFQDCSKMGDWKLNVKGYWDWQT